MAGLLVVGGDLIANIRLIMKDGRVVKDTRA
jgi:hypothetical protein